MLLSLPSNATYLNNWTPDRSVDSKRTHLSEVIRYHWLRKWANLPPTGIWGKGIGKKFSSSGSCTDGGDGLSLTMLFTLYHFGFLTCGRGGISSNWHLAIPWRFSRALLHRASVVVALLHSQSCFIHSYLDDSLFKNMSQYLLRDHIHFVIGWFPYFKEEVVASTHSVTDKSEKVACLMYPPNTHLKLSVCY
jgi:hypothetical protein